MIKINGNDIRSIGYLGRPMISVYINGQLVWPERTIPDTPEQTLSCFFNGYWIDDMPWTDDTPWMDEYAQTD